MLDICVDLETMGKTPGCAIVAIGAVAFDLHACALGERFYTAVDLTSCMRYGLTTDPDTIKWWLGQSDTARRALTGAAKPLASALLEFTEYVESCGPTDNVRIWGNGPSFDNAILSAAYRAADLDPPWRFWNERCVRTLTGMFPAIEERPRQGTHHHALDDAEYQAEHLIHIRQTLRAKKAA